MPRCRSVTIFRRLVQMHGHRRAFSDSFPTYARMARNWRSQMIEMRIRTARPQSHCPNCPSQNHRTANRRGHDENDEIQSLTCNNILYTHKLVGASSNKDLGLVVSISTVKQPMMMYSTQITKKLSLHVPNALPKCFGFAVLSSTMSNWNISHEMRNLFYRYSGYHSYTNQSRRCGSRRYGQQVPWK